MFRFRQWPGHQLIHPHTDAIITSSNSSKLCSLALLIHVAIVKCVNRGAWRVRGLLASHINSSITAGYSASCKR